MNLSLLDPFAVASDFPETLTETLSYGYSTCVKFNRKGDYLASGLADGNIVIIDVDTNSVILILRGHVRAITSLCWSEDGRYLLSSSRDFKVDLWDLKQGSAIRTVVFDSPIWGSTMFPDDIFKFTASLFENDAAIVDMSEKDNAKIVKLSTKPVMANSEVNSSGSEEREGSHRKRRLKRHQTLVCTLSKDGKYIITGTSRGWINVIDRANVKTLRSFKVCDSNIKGIEISVTGSRMIVNAGDKTLRQYLVAPSWESIQLQQKYQDVVNKIQYNGVKFSYDSEYLCASTLGSTHDIYIWEAKMGSLVKILEGSKEELISVDWNYRRCCIAATGMDSGTIYLWSVVYPQKWSNLAPDFEEIEENIDYEEKEDEFDLIDSAKESGKVDQQEQYDVDVVTKDEKDARGFPFIDSFVIETKLDDFDAIGSI